MTAVAPPYELLVCGTLVLPDGMVPQGWVAVSGGKIMAVGTGPRPDAACVHDAGQAYVMPGFIDGQTHATSYAGLPGFRSTTRSAVAGGITTLVDMPYDNPDPLNTVERHWVKVEAVERESCADVALYATVAPGQGVGEIEALVKAGACAFKISSFESHPVRFPRIPADEMLAILESTGALKIPLGLHNEDQEIVRASIAALKRQGRTQPEWHEPSRPVAAELAATAAFLALGTATGAHVHIVHISCAPVFQLVRRFRDAGTHATAETCVHYLHFDAARDTARLGARMKVSPPIRPHALPGIWQALADGDIDFISSDHSSWPLANKQTDSIFDAGAGIPGLETCAPALYTGLRQHTPEPERELLRYLCERPAKFFGLWPRKGTLAPGSDADFAILEARETVFHEADTHDDLNWSPFDGERFACRIATTFLRGMKVWDEGKVLGTPGIGQFIPRLAM
jgi:allantoinase